MNSPKYTQHFLNDRTVLKEMLSQFQISKEDLVIDIGAGKGALTSHLSQQAQKVIAVELDAQLANALRKKFGNHSNVKVLNKNILNMPLPGYPFKVVANIPYNITTDILGKLMDVPNTSFTGGIMVMEWGAAKRFTRKVQANPRIIGWNTWFDLSIVRQVSPRSFSPAPSVQSAMVKVCRNPNALINPLAWREYLSFVATLLEHPRIRAKDVLKQLFTWNQIKRISKDTGLNYNQPVQSLTISQWAHCFNIMHKLVPKRLHPSMPGRYKKLYRR